MNDRCAVGGDDQPEEAWIRLPGPGVGQDRPRTRNSTTCLGFLQIPTDLGQRPGADGPAFDLAFLDPPYGKGLGETALAKLAAGGWLASGAVVMFERGADEADFEVEGFTKLDARDYGAARVHFLRFGLPAAD